MRVLVAYATRHGATQGIAERIGETLGSRGLDATVLPVGEVGSVRRLEDYDAFVVGSAAYMGHWLKDATRFVEAHQEMLASRPTWLFSSGPIGTDTVDKHGRDVLETGRPAEFAELDETVHPREERVFFGAFDPDAKPIGLWERIGAPFMRLPGAREAMPAGDFRDWPAIEAWAARIAEQLQPKAAAV